MTSDKTCSLVFLQRTTGAGETGTQEVLLAMKKRGFGAGRWNGAGGKVEKGETIEQSMVREAIEEINVVPRTWHKVAVHDFVMDADGQQPWRMHVHTFVCTEWDGEPEESDEMAPRWFPISGIPYAQMWADDIYWLPAVLSGGRVKTTFTFDKAEQLLRADIEPVTSFK